jgi:hypothetical protein
MTTTTFPSGSAVQSGYYFNASRWHIEPIARNGDHLPAGRGGWFRVPTAAALLLVPILGAAFLMFLPLIGFVLLARAAAQPLVEVFRSQAQELAATVTPGWQPGEAHFTGKPQENGRVEEKGQSSDGAALDALAAEIEERRRNR